MIRQSTWIVASIELSIQGRAPNVGQQVTRFCLFSWIARQRSGKPLEVAHGSYAFFRTQPNVLVVYSHIIVTTSSLRCESVHRQVSVSEFISLVKVLTARKSVSSGARATGAFDKKQAYMFLRCVDQDGSRRVALRDLVGFVFAVWTEELSRLMSVETSGTTGTRTDAETTREKRHQLQKVRVVLSIDVRVTSGSAACGVAYKRWGGRVDLGNFQLSSPLVLIIGTFFFNEPVSPRTPDAHERTLHAIVSKMN